VTNRIQNQVALVSGASRGIGQEIALMLAREGASIALLSRTREALEETKKKCESLGAKVAVIPADLSRSSICSEVIGQTVQELGGLNILINNAGVLEMGPTQEADLEKWDRVLDVNLKSLIHLTVNALPEIQKAPRGAIINIASVAGKWTMPGLAIYNASKFGVVGFSGALFDDVREKNIKVCDICPGWVRTDMASSAGLDGSKMIQPQDIADTVKFVLNFSDEGCPTEIIIRPQQTP